MTFDKQAYMREYMREMEETKRLRDENTRMGKLVAGLKLEEELHSVIEKTDLGP